MVRVGAKVLAMNTEIFYMYRDDCNYKNFPDHPVVLKGKLTKKQIAAIYDKMMDKEHFIAEQLGLPVLRYSCDRDVDHCWHELDEIVQTSSEPTMEMDAKTFYDTVIAIEEWEMFPVAYTGEQGAHLRKAIEIALNLLAEDVLHYEDSYGSESTEAKEARQHYNAVAAEANHGGCCHLLYGDDET